MLKYFNPHGLWIVGGKRLETVEEAMKYKFPTWGTAGMDEECCYRCSSAMKHPKGACYVAGHVAVLLIPDSTLCPTNDILGLGIPFA